MRKIFLLFVLCTMLITSVFSQSLADMGCATPTSEAQLDRVSSFIAKGMPGAKGTAGVDSLPLTIHIVGKTNGTGYYELEKLFPLLCNMNTHYATASVYFYIAWPIRYINNDNYYDHGFSTGVQMMRNNNVPNTINIYFARTAIGACGYYAPATDAVVMSNGCAAVTSKTLTHELGHFFDLPHTFSGWEGGNTPAVPENVARTGTDANCTSAGDRFCDTGPDYIGNTRWNCPYTGQQLVDPLGVPFRPDSSLYLSYADDACMTRFSPQQLAFMQNNVHVVRQNTLPNSAVPYSTMDTPSVVYPSPLMYSNDKTIRWNRVPGAEYYLVQLATQGVPNLYRERWLTADTFVQVTTQMYDNVNFYTYITPLNNKNLCAGKVRQQLFTYTSALSVKDVLSGANIELIPNPATSFAELRVDDNFKGDYTVYLMNMAGQVVKQQQVSFNGTNKVVPVVTSDLGNGVYTVRVAGDKGSVVKKLVVQH